MNGTVKNLLLGATLIAGVSAIAASPAQAISIDFGSNTNYRTYTTVPTTTSVDNDAAAAIAALTDGGNPAQTNVELWYSDENPTAYTGFTVKQGQYSAFVSNITNADWAVFGQQWLDDFLGVYSSSLLNPASFAKGSFLYNQTLAAVVAGVPRANDPNIGSVSIDGNGVLSMSLIGHYNLFTLNTNPFVAAIAPFFKAGTILQMSEVAKVVTGGQTHYAYSFAATQSGINTTDGTDSFTGIYNTSIQLVATPPDETASVPEPATGLGLLALGGLAVIKRRKKAQA